MTSASTEPTTVEAHDVPTVVVDEDGICYAIQIVPTLPGGANACIQIREGAREDLTLLAHAIRGAGLLDYLTSHRQDFERIHPRTPPSAVRKRYGVRAGFVITSSPDEIFARQRAEYEAAQAAQRKRLEEYEAEAKAREARRNMTDAEREAQDLCKQLDEERARRAETEAQLATEREAREQRDAEAAAITLDVDVDEDALLEADVKADGGEAEAEGAEARAGEAGEPVSRRVRARRTADTVNE